MSQYHCIGGHAPCQSCGTDRRLYREDGTLVRLCAPCTMSQANKRRQRQWDERTSNNEWVDPVKNHLSPNPVRVLNDELRAEIWRLYQERMPVFGIARKMGLKRHTVHTYIWRRKQKAA